MLLLLGSDRQGIRHQVVYLPGIPFAVSVDCTDRIPSQDASASSGKLQLMLDVIGTS